MEKTFLAIPHSTGRVSARGTRSRFPPAVLAAAAVYIYFILKPPAPLQPTLVANKQFLHFMQMNYDRHYSNPVFKVISHMAVRKALKKMIPDDH